MTSSNDWRLSAAGRLLPPPRLASEAPARDYAVVIVEDKYLTHHGRAPHNLASLDHPALMGVLRSLADKLAKLHAAGYEAGNATIEHVLVDKKTREPFFDAITHLAPLGKESHGMNEVLTLLASFYRLGSLSKTDIRTLISHYLDAEPGARASAEDYLRAHPGKSNSAALVADSDSSHTHAHAHPTLEDRLLERFEKRYHLFFSP